MPARIGPSSRLPRANPPSAKPSPPNGPRPAIRILLAIDEANERTVFCKLVAQESDFTVVAEATTAHDVVATTLALRPDLVLLDISPPRSHGFDALKVLRQVSRVRVLLLASDVETRSVMRALELGAYGVLPKRAKALLPKCIRTVMKGEFWIARNMVGELVRLAIQRPRRSQVPVRPPSRLTLRELEIVEAVAAGCSNRDIAQKFAISLDTVKHHLTNIFDKTGTGNRLELALFALNRGLAAGR